ncbi:MAG: hypothetical protein KBB39_06035 [Phycicoccus sp.]|nr:hypothetical protein [Phycicoccus sp.]
MIDPGALPVRLVRTALLALVAIGLGAAGHALAGHPVSSAALLTAALVVTPLLGWLSERTWQPGRLALALGGVQVLTHVTLSAVGGAAFPASTGSQTHGLAAHSLAAHALPSASDLGVVAATSPAGHTGLLTTLTPAMLIGHLVATIASAVALARLDAAVATVTHFLAPARPGAARLTITARARWVHAHHQLRSGLVGPSPRSSRGPPSTRLGLALS